MNLVEQIFAQAKAGSANGEGFGQFFAQGVQAGQHQQQIDMQKQQLAMEIAQAPLKNTLLQQDSQLKLLAIQNGLTARQSYLDATEAFTGLADQVAPLLRDGQIDDAQNVIMEAGVNNAFLLTDPRFKGLYDFTTKAQDAKLELLRAKAASSAHADFPPQEVLVPSSIPGLPPTRVMREGPNTSKIMVDMPTAEEKAKAAITKDATKLALKDIYDEIKRKNIQMETESETTGMPWNKQENPKRKALAAEIEALREQARQLSGGHGLISSPGSTNRLKWTPDGFIPATPAQ